MFHFGQISLHEFSPLLRLSVSAAPRAPALNAIKNFDTSHVHTMLMSDPLLVRTYVLTGIHRTGLQNRHMECSILRILFF